MAARKSQSLLAILFLLVGAAGAALLKTHGQPLVWLRHWQAHATGSGSGSAGVPGQVAVYFSPKGGCAEAVVEVLAGARKTVLVQAYSFTHAAIAKALVDAYRRGVMVEIILDKSQETEKYSEADFTSHAGIPTWIDAVHAIAHNKVMVIDGDTVITGSFNFTKSAEERNAENLLVLRQAPELALKYTRNWEAHRAHSKRYGQP